jgi:hypothetical protein
MLPASDVLIVRILTTQDDDCMRFHWPGLAITRHCRRQPHLLDNRLGPQAEDRRVINVKREFFVLEKLIAECATLNPPRDVTTSTSKIPRTTLNPASRQLTIAVKPQVKVKT